MTKQKQVRRLLALALCLIVGIPLSVAADMPKGGEITAFAPLAEETAAQNVDFNTPISDLDLPEILSATVRDESETQENTVSVSVTWTPSPEYDGETAGTYTFTPEISGEYTLAEDVSLPLITVTVNVPEETPAPSESTEGEIIAFDPLAEETAVQAVGFGTPLADLDLPESLTATVRDGAQETTSSVPVTWTASPEYDGEAADTYAFTPEISGDYTVAEGVSLPAITVTVTAEETVTPPVVMAGMMGAMDVSDTYTFDLYYGNISITSDTVAYYDASGSQAQVFSSGDTLVIMQTGSSSSTSNRIMVNGGTGSNPLNITLSGVNIDMSSSGGCAFELQSTSKVNLTLADGTENTLVSGGIYAGLSVPTNAAVIIDGTGTLNVTGGTNAAGIGGNGGENGTDGSDGSRGTTGGSGGSCGEITINGGTIDATGRIGGGSGGKGGNGSYSAGTVGTAAKGGNGGDGGTLTITGGIIQTDTIGGGDGGSGGSGSWSSGANGGNGGDSGTITIRGGTVTTNGNIGGGDGGDGAKGGISMGSACYSGDGGTGGDLGTVTITGGTIEVNGNLAGGNGGDGANGVSFGAGASAGGDGGTGGDGATVIITGSTMKVTGNIGGGNGGSGGDGGTDGSGYQASDGSDGSDGSGGSNQITGGSLSIGGAIAQAPTNGSGTNVYLTTVTLHGATTKIPVYSLTTDAAYEYGVEDVTTDTGGKLYIWLPDGTEITCAATTAGEYTGSVTTTANTAASYGTLSKAAETIKPTVIGVTPSGGGIPLSGDIEITFSEVMDTGTTGVISVNGGGVVTGGAWSNYNKTYTLSYSVSSNYQAYTIHISGFADISGNTMEPDDTHSFTTVVKCGNGAYVLESDGDSAYTGSYTDGGLLQMTVNSGQTGFTYFSVKISVDAGHTGNEVCVFVHIRKGVQISMNATMADFDTVNSAYAAFNVKAGDVVEVYIVDVLSNAADTTPAVL